MNRLRLRLLVVRCLASGLLSDLDLDGRLGLGVHHLIAKGRGDFLEVLLARLPTSCQLCFHFNFQVQPFKAGYVREVEVGYDEEDGRARRKHVVVVFLDVGKRAGARLGDCKCEQTPLGMDSGKVSNVLATLTIKCEADARPMTLLRRATGSTSAPYSHVVLLSMPSATVSKMML